ncbi:MAG TPA: isoprenylcysteine carboxylmethyltransferase family protein [Frankiaceae bacterium]|nr:isoprenylcysteine carboxylmethyltransferase family protein [Frankiaceae bacterium]
MTHAFALRCGTGPAGADRPRVLAPPPLVYLPALGAGFALQALLSDIAPPDRAVRVLGYALVVAGGALAGSFVRAFLRARTSIDFGRATTLVTTGPYRLSRNPGYVGMALVYAGIAVASGAWLAFATVVPALVAIDRCVIRGEERHLEKVFGDEYRAYTRRVRRWL